MNKQRGFVGIDLDGLITGLIIVGICIGVILGLVIPYAWNFIKPFIHSITA